MSVLLDRERERVCVCVQHLFVVDCLVDAQLPRRVHLLNDELFGDNVRACLPLGRTSVCNPPSRRVSLAFNER